MKIKGDCASIGLSSGTWFRLFDIFKLISETDYPIESSMKTKSALEVRAWENKIFVKN